MKTPSTTTLLILLTGAALASLACAPPATEEAAAPAAHNAGPATAPAAAPGKPALEPQLTLTADQTHNRFSRVIPPVATVASGAVIEAYTQEASDGQLIPGSTVDDVVNLDFDPIHPLTGPVAVEGAEPGDVLKVTLHEIELGDYGWVAVTPGFGWLADEFPDAYLKTVELGAGATEVRFNDRVRIPLEPFPGVLGVAPDTDEMLSTIPPRANGGNMDNKYLTEGTVVYLPVFVPGALFSIGASALARIDPPLLVRIEPAVS